jgi:hypothetical protein
MRESSAPIKKEHTDSEEFAIQALCKLYTSMPSPIGTKATPFEGVKA